ncbi:MAG: threonylcarbamoyl-AMP synthase [Planctomycetaceae bacterium]|nr:threonylcarbamoyl-AMP synthase [Planctomycetaceae bacterium]
MAAAIINVRTADDPRDAIHRAVQALAEGKLVAVPTETVYGVAASALNEEAVARLSRLKQRAADQPFTLAIKSADDARDYVPCIPAIGERLARRCWPGPVTLVVDSDHPDSLLKQLPDSVQQAVCPQGTLGLRVPAHEVVLAVARLTAGPLVLTSANRRGRPEANSSEEVAAALGDEIDLILDDGPSKFGQPSSVVRAGSDGLKLLRSGVINEQALSRLAGYILVFVCTGNTCRSPMAEALMRRRVAEHLKCSIADLEEQGVMIVSAGIAAHAGDRASLESAQVVKERGLDLSSHESQPLGERLVRFADLVLTLTRGHREAIVGQWPDAAERVKLLCGDGSNVADPIGGPIELYRRCADQIDANLGAWLDEIDFSSLPPGNPTDSEGSGA